MSIYNGVIIKPYITIINHDVYRVKSMTGIKAISIVFRHYYDGNMKRWEKGNTSKR